MLPACVPSPEALQVLRSWLLQPLGPWSLSHCTPPYSHLPKDLGQAGCGLVPSSQGHILTGCDPGGPPLLPRTASCPALSPHSVPLASPDDDPVTDPECGPEHAPAVLSTDSQPVQTWALRPAQALRLQQWVCPWEQCYPSWVTLAICLASLGTGVSLSLCEPVFGKGGCPCPASPHVFGRGQRHLRGAGGVRGPLRAASDLERREGRSGLPPRSVAHSGGRKSTALGLSVGGLREAGRDRGAGQGQRLSLVQVGWPPSSLRLGRLLTSRTVIYFLRAWHILGVESFFPPALTVTLEWLE